MGSPSALLKLEGAIFLFYFISRYRLHATPQPCPSSGGHLCALPLPGSRVPVAPRGELLHTSAALVFTPGDTVSVATIQIPLDLLALEVREACDPGSHGAITIRETALGRLPLPEYCTDSRLKHTPQSF